MNLDNFNTNFNNSEEFEDEPTSVLSQIADIPFTVNKVKAGTSKSGNAYCIVWTDKTYEAGVATDEVDKDDKTIYEKQKVKKFFVTVREPKQFFSDPTNITKINDGEPCGPVKIHKKNFTPEEIEVNKKLKGKTHYVLSNA